MSYNQLQKGNSNAAKSRRQYRTKNTNIAVVFKNRGHWRAPNSEQHMSHTSRTYMHGSCASAEGVWQWLNQV